MKHPLTRRLFLKGTALGLLSSSALGFSFVFGKKPEPIKHIGKTLILYFSQTGATTFIANKIHQKVGGDIYEIKPLKPYVGTYHELKVIARQEQDNYARPPLAGTLPDISKYDTIFIGFPTWLYTMPMVMFTMLEQADFTGKNIVPFNTHGGTGFSESLRHMQQLEPKATITEGIEVLDIDVRDSSTNREMNDWLKNLGFKDIQNA